MLSPAQLLLFPIILFILAKTFIAYKKGGVSKVFFVLWIGFWFIMLFFLANPSVLTKIAGFFEISRGVDLAVYLSIIVLFFSVYRILIYLSSLEQKITKLVRQNALKTSRLPNKNRKQKSKSD